jgi:hypothetical protein
VRLNVSIERAPISRLFGNWLRRKKPDSDNPVL